MDDVQIIIYGSVIASWSLPGGMVWKWARQRAVRIERIAKMNAPVRSGELRRSITSEYEGSLPYQVIMNVYADAEHGLWVHEGTTGPIRPLYGKIMTLPPYGAYPQVKARFVRGQDANPFLADALDTVIRDL